MLRVFNTNLYENEFQNPQIFQQTISHFPEHSTLARAFFIKDCSNRTHIFVHLQTTDDLLALNWRKKMCDWGQYVLKTELFGPGVRVRRLFKVRSFRTRTSEKSADSDSDVRNALAENDVFSTTVLVWKMKSILFIPCFTNRKMFKFKTKYYYTVLFA
jgi:hypothetical protein